MNLELARRIAFTLGALLVYRIGTFIPLPGIDTAVWARVFGAHSGGLLSLADIAAGGGARRLAIFSLGIMPFITAAILIQLVSIGSSRLRAVAMGDRGRNRIVAYTQYLTVGLAAFQAYGIALGLENVAHLVSQPGPLFRLSTVLTLTAGTLFLVWLSRQITERGVGNGLALILAVGMLVNLPISVAATVDAMHRGVIGLDLVVVIAVLAAIATAVIVFIEGARRPVEVDYARREIGGRVVESRSVPLMLKLNNAGLIPTVFAGWLIAILALAIVLVAGAHNPLLRQLGHGHLAFLALFSLLIVAFALFYTAFLLDPDQASETLARYGGAVRGVAAGEATAAYLDSIVTRVTVVGAIYLALVFVIPELLIVYFGLPFYLGGASFLVVVCAALDLGAQFKQEAQLKLGGQRP